MGSGMVQWSPSLLAQKVHSSNLGNAKNFQEKFQSALKRFIKLRLCTDMSKNKEYLRRAILHVEVYEMGPAIDIYKNRLFQAKKMAYLHQLRGEVVRGEQCRHKTYLLSQRELESHWLEWISSGKKVSSLRKKIAQK